MKKMMIALTMMLLTAATGKAMSYEQARNEALFLTDKMAYELNLTDAQYEAAYEINLDYLMGVTSRDDVYGVYWERRNLDLSYILLDWQWEAFRAATYFFRPLYWLDGFWHFAIYGRYPHRDYFFFGRPVFYATYRGGHAWHVVGGRGYYHSHSDHFRHVSAGRHHVGMHDRWERGEFNHGRHHASRPGIGNATHHGGPRSSSTQSTVNRPSHHQNSGHSTMAENRPSSGGSSSHSSGNLGRSGGSSSHSSGNLGRSGGSSSHSSGNLGRSGDNSSHSSGSFGRSGDNSSHSSGSFSRSGGSSSHSSGSFSRSSGTTRSSGSFSRGGASHGSSSAGRSSSGGRSYGGRR